jgi:hypothetical protein
MRFYITAAGETPEQGIELPDVETALLQTADAALAIARDLLDSSSTDVSLEVSSDQGRVGRPSHRISADQTRLTHAVFENCARRSLAYSSMTWRASSNPPPIAVLILSRHARPYHA